MYKVILVDDEPANIDAQRRAIGKRTDHFEIIGEAFTVDHAIKLIEELEPDVVLTDIKMPNRSGIELIKHISKIEKKIVSIAVSGYSDFSYVHDAFSYGAFDYLLKPVEPNKMADLFSRIYRLLESMSENQAPQILPQAKVSSQELVAEIHEYIENHLAEDNSIIRICSVFNISQPYLSKIFKKHKGLTYNEFLMKLKMEKAKQLLSQKEGYLIGEVSLVLGFSDQFYFSKVFKTIVGVTPREFRKTNTE